MRTDTWSEGVYILFNNIHPAEPSNPERTTLPLPQSNTSLVHTHTHARTHAYAGTHTSVVRHVRARQNDVSMCLWLLRCKLIVAGLLLYEAEPLFPPVFSPYAPSLCVSVLKSGFVYCLPTMYVHVCVCVRLS